MNYCACWSILRSVTSYVSQDVIFSWVQKTKEIHDTLFNLGYCNFRKHRLDICAHVLITVPNAVCELQPQWAQVLIHSPTLKNSPGHPIGS